MIRKKRFFIGGLIILFAVAYLGYRSFEGSATYYFTISELQAQGDRIAGDNVRVTGRVAPGSLDWNPENNTLQFTITDGERELPALYRGIIPDTFKAGNTVVVQGVVESNGVFHAYSILTKCPSKYTPQE